jgi:NADH-quinone oxidoreductase subunit B
MMGPRLDPERFGMQAVAGGLRQCDLLIVEGTVTKKMAKRLKVVYEQMAKPRYVIAMGDCACSGGLFHDSYSIVNDVHKLFPVDVYVAGCPPRPEALLSAIVKLREKIRREEVFA